MKSKPEQVAKELKRNIEHDEPLLMIMVCKREYDGKEETTTRMHFNDPDDLVKALVDNALILGEPRATVDFIDKSIEVMKGAKRVITYQLKKRAKEN